MPAAQHCGREMWVTSAHFASVFRSSQGTSCGRAAHIVAWRGVAEEMTAFVLIEPKLAYTLQK
jgi:hypothetical protein